MARDLLYGKISRDWALGASVLSLPTEANRRRMGDDVRASQEIGPLAKVVETETRDAYQMVVKLSSSGKLPAIERRSFKPILQRWFALRDKRQGKFLGEDYVELVNLRDATREYRRKLENFAQQKSPASPSVTLSAGSSQGLAVPLLVAAGATGLALLIFSKR